MRGAVLKAGLVGRGILQSRSPSMHMGEAAAQGLELEYRLHDLDAPGAVQDLARVLDDVEAQGYLGVNITYPFKQAVIPLLHELSPDAERLGAVNTVVMRDGRRFGHNTDWSGFAESFRRGLPGARRERVVQAGAGGAGSAVAYALLSEGVDRLELFDLDALRAEALATRLCALFGAGRCRVLEHLDTRVSGVDGVVNTTPVGMAKHPGMSVPRQVLRARQWVADAVYVPLDTELLTAARALGCETLDGGGMAVFQAADAFSLIVGRKADAERMRARFLEALAADPP